jgi:hypothetical protein
MIKYLALAVALAGPMVPAAAAQDQSRNPRTVCIDTPVTPPASLPPANSPPVVFLIVPCFPEQDNVTLIDPQTYLYYMQIQQKRSRPSEGVWVTYDDSVEKLMREDFARLYNTNFLDNISIETQDYTFSNGVIGKILLYNMEERQRVKIVTYQHSKKFEDSKIDEKLKELGAEIRLDTFIDAALLKKASGIIRDMMREKGFQFAEVKPVIEELDGGPKLVRLTFHMDDGPKVQIKNIDFLGNEEVSDGDLMGRDEAEQGTLVPVLDHRPRHLPGEPVRGGCAADCREIPREGLHLRAGRRPRSEVSRRLQGRRNALGRAACPGR